MGLFQAGAYFYFFVETCEDWAAFGADGRAAGGGSACGWCGCCRGWIQFFVCHCFDPLYCFGFVHTWEQGLRFAKRSAWNQLAPTQSVQFEFAEGDGLAEERPDFGGAVG